MAEAEKGDYSLEGVLQYLFQCRDQVHLWHLQTENYAEHKALDAYYGHVLESADSIVESLQGHLGKRVAGMIPLRTAPYKGTKWTSAYLAVVMTWLGGFRANSKYEDIQNMIDDLTGKTAQTIYLLTLV